MSRLFVKICGITTIEDALAAVSSGADAIGLNFYAPSPRCVTPETARTIAAAVPTDVLTIGVFVNETRERIAAVQQYAGLRGVQFHGDEDPESCDGWSVTTIKAVRLGSPADARQLSEYRVDFILVDAYVEGHFGGTGKPINVEHLGDLDRRRLILAGGLTPDNVAPRVRLVRPFGVDVASGVESVPGRKDHERMRRFIEHARAA